jgi:hypothetical protein
MNSKPTRRNKGNAARRRSLERFGVLNGFVDFGLAGLARSEVAVWLVLHLCRHVGQLEEASQAHDMSLVLSGPARPRGGGRIGPGHCFQCRRRVPFR